MAKARVWKPTDQERIGWEHPYIQITKTAPGYLIQELYNYADTTWEQWLHRNKSLWTKRNRRPWIYLESLGRCSMEMDDDEEDQS